MSEKIYLETEVKFYPDGKVVPLSYMWEDQKVKIDEVLAVSLTFSGGAGAKYACQVQGKQVNLYFVVNKWYIEKE